MRKALLLLHRYVGLGIAAFLALSGITGSVIAFNHEIDEGLNPGFYAASTEGPALPLRDLVARVETVYPDIFIDGASLPDHAGAPVSLWAEPREGKDETINQIFVDPATGEILGARNFGACCFSAENLIPFLYVFHYSLSLPERWGVWLMGLIAIFWFFDCFVGAVLTFPKGRPFFANWRPAFGLKRGAGSYRRNLDLHRAGGLWSWLLLAMLALSGIAMNLQYEVFRPLLSLVTPLSPSPLEIGMPRFTEKVSPPALGFDEAMARGVEVAAAQGEPGRALGAYHFGQFRAWLIVVGEEEHGPGLGAARIYLDDATGDPLLTELPGRGTAGDIFLQLQFPLHSGQIIGLPGRILIAVMGLVVATLSVTGIILWGYKRKGRVTLRRRRREVAATS
ncbi:PepSY-associated TM helix domain-containing protein [Zavarzinia sp.]|uniref:PepSY-associated TM helix domain-containing protein n=1 Tax=Zavarzinia sp. TaxID=2027920 RepID=UPI003BB52731